MENIRIKYPERLKKKIDKFRKDNAKGFHVVADFDATLTPYSVEGKKMPSSYSYINEGGYLGKEFNELTSAMYKKYYPIEISLTIPQEEKNRKMIEWWTKYWNLFIEYGLDKNMINDIIKKVQLRKNCLIFLDTLKEENIPLLIFSAGIGDIIREYLRSIDKFSPNLQVISNLLEFDKDGKAIRYDEDHIIHTFNKNEVQVKDHPYHKEIEKRKNVILLGDQIGDLNMAEGMPHDCIIKIGFLNAHVGELFEKYSEEFDVVILNDDSMDYINRLLKEIIKK